MNKRILMFFVLMSAMAGISKCEQQNPSRIFFINWEYLHSNILEFSDLAKECDSLQAKKIPGDHPRMKAYSEKYCIANQKVQDTLNLIAKKLNASYVLDPKQLGAYFYADPLLNISKELVDTLNKEYQEQLKMNPVAIPIQCPQVALHEAILMDSAKDIQEAIEAGADIHNKIDGQLPISWAVLYKKLDAIKSLLKYGAKVDETLFKEALQLNDIKSAILLAKKCNANLNAIYSDGCLTGTLLQLAANKYDFESVLLLINSGAYFSGYTKIFNRGSLMYLVVKYGLNYGSGIYLELIQRLINKDYDVNDIWLETAEHGNLYGGQSSDQETLKLFLKNGANPNFIIKRANVTTTPLFVAISGHDTMSIVEILLDAGADVNQKINPYYNQSSLYLNGPQTPLSFAINKGNISIAELLRKHGASL